MQHVESTKVAETIFALIVYLDVVNKIEGELLVSHLHLYIVLAGVDLQVFTEKDVLCVPWYHQLGKNHLYRVADVTQMHLCQAEFPFCKFSSNFINFDIDAICAVLLD